MTLEPCTWSPVNSVWMFREMENVHVALQQAGHAAEIFVGDHRRWNRLLVIREVNVVPHLLAVIVAENPAYLPHSWEPAVPPRVRRQKNFATFSRKFTI